MDHKIVEAFMRVREMPPDASGALLNKDGLCTGSSTSF